MKVSIGADHCGVDLRQQLIQYLQKQGFDIIDHGTLSRDSVDYPDYAQLVGEDVVKGKADFGILVCDSGMGICMAANKIRGIHAAILYNNDIARFCKEHNNANVVCFGGKYQTPYMAEQFLETYLNSKYEGGRHDRRLNKMDALSDLNLAKR
ncbi:MAG: ribose 5-phosphate isomerase B [Verrucomicrobia bacterium CG_4_10_14_3_um_filter_43_23]|nr:MAG: ribose 5-phosphate isomerase B [Verrucomicrobia bacterium CG1_02_43_26]PIP59976.1 MAG: ribose 5-phosphate isomerase B [Verrucomicrobia bacterium CG22_combo_CG10-13_8_21_14_all_43_17]PIX58011.1 MAG: ribose 5-phosphate isomerase B [Verrucomicrobia bacterium CG_4_10_14_3_um_filter_43_23]PIY61887.1 MAG: ribose 5-phosphate isomerase B [Verrucomicrobia bacterium CG_4_10_14_0_8_um_filter_43_34]PJA43969.1 MAG: ribose 5-phosphate isomerase B [Verrucomicrobia bacterium CG_4_9_14_3_um_filter_43_20